MFRKIFALILMVSVLHPAFGQSTERPLSDNDAESNQKQDTFIKPNVLGVFDQIEFSKSNAEDEASNRYVINRSRPFNDIFSYGRSKSMVFVTPKEVESIEPFQSPETLNPIYGVPWLLPSLLQALNVTNSAPANCQKLDIIAPSKSGGLVEAHFEAECTSNIIPPLSWNVELTLQSPSPNISRTANTPESVPTVIFNKANTNLGLGCTVSGVWEVTVLFTLNSRIIIHSTMQSPASINCTPGQD